MEPTLINLVLTLNCSELAMYEVQMSLTARELNQLKKIAAIANQMIAKAEATLAAAEAKAAAPAKKTAKKALVKADTKAAKAAAKEVVAKTAKKTAAKPSAKNGKRTRRTGDELAAFRQMLSDERKNGVSVAELSKQHGVSAAYIYQL